jgi:D-glycero-D-manno-heptose 1,7-bisphosphate phosphatase
MTAGIEDRGAAVGEGSRLPQGGGVPAAFLDRDGVIIEEVHYLSEPSQVRLLPGSAAAVARLNRLGVPVVVATNQAGVAHGFFDESRIADVHRRVDELLATEGAKVDRYYYCPHHPAATVAKYRLECDCRKPRPGMLLRAAAELGLDLHRCWLVGDKLSDIEAGMAAGCNVVLVRTGYGDSVVPSLEGLDLQRIWVAGDLAEAVEMSLAIAPLSPQGA